MNDQISQLHALRLKIAAYSQTLAEDRKSTRLNSSHGYISYAVFCLKKKTDHSDVHVRGVGHVDRGSDRRAVAPVHVLRPDVEVPGRVGVLVHHCACGRV